MLDVGHWKAEGPAQEGAKDVGAGNGHPPCIPSASDQASSPLAQV